MEARLVAIHDSARTHQSDFADRFGERSKSRRVVLDPSIGSEIVIEVARARNVCDRHATHSIYGEGLGKHDEQLRCNDRLDVCVREIFSLGETRMECARTQYELALRTPRMDV